MLQQRYALQRAEELGDAGQRVTGTLATLEAIFVELGMDVVPVPFEQPRQVLASVGHHLELARARTRTAQIDRQPDILGPGALGLDQGGHPAPIDVAARGLSVGRGRAFERLLDFVALRIVGKVGTGRILVRHRRQQLLEIERHEPPPLRQRP